MAYLIGMILGNGEIQRNSQDTIVTIDIPHKKLVTDDCNDIPTYVKGNTFQRLMLKTLKLFIFESNEWSKNEYLCFLKNHDLEILDYDVFNAGQPLCVAIIKNSK